MPSVIPRVLAFVCCIISFVVSPNYLSCLKMWQSGFTWKLQGARALPFLIEGMDWRGKRVVIAGMGAFAVENVQGTQGSKNATLKRHWVLIPTWVHSRWWRKQVSQAKEHWKFKNTIIIHYILYDAFYWGVNNRQLEMCTLVNFGKWPCRNCNFAWPWAMPVACFCFPEAHCLGTWRIRGYGGGSSSWHHLPQGKNSEKWAAKVTKKTRFGLSPSALPSLQVHFLWVDLTNILGAHSPLDLHIFAPWKAIDYLNFVKPWDEKYKHDTQTNVKQFLRWKQLYEASGCQVPECWPKQVKHDGHTISVSDIWFIAHHMKKLSTKTGNSAPTARSLGRE